MDVFDRSVSRRILNLARLLDSAIVDGSGVLHDPNGIDRSELTRLAKARQTVSNVDRTKIGPGGYLILLEDKGFVLPCEWWSCMKSRSLALNRAYSLQMQPARSLPMA